MKKIFVYGGCISRDVFNEPYNLGELDLVAYIARYSIAKLCCPSIRIKINEKKVPSAFQRKAIENDARNNLLYFLDLRDYDYLLVDFMFTRFKLVEYESTLLTYSTELSKSGLISPSSHRIISNDSVLYWENFKKGLDIFLEFLSDNNRLHKLLINKIYLATHDDSGKAFDDVGPQNDFLDRIYDLLSNSLDNSQILEYDQAHFIAKSDHHWGRSPMHFIDDFYHDCYQKIVSL
ncbi:DUF6270 domain-containing protein [Wohlfahrtiimonas larvae]|uniref:Uncharacterized protein n=1 Tax=Wohlfahrtiimonas larvae TaxID=1157986 RepID=A0ABP9MMB8_9GAMM|nr:DUF6270 domain-containing protein [Wohlfahrtiimonas larvae]